MPRKKVNPVVDDYSSYVFELPLTADEKKTIIDILWKDFEWKADYSSFQIKTFDEDLDKKIEEENELRKTARFIAEKGLLDVITIALAISWNRRDDFKVIREIVRKYSINEYLYYHERDKEVMELSNLISRIKYTRNYLRPHIGNKKKIIKIEGVPYKIPEKRLWRLRRIYTDKNELRDALLKEAELYKEESVFAQLEYSNEDRAVQANSVLLFAQFLCCSLKCR